LNPKDCVAEALVISIVLMYGCSRYILFSRIRTRTLGRDMHLTATALLFLRAQKSHVPGVRLLRQLTDLQLEHEVRVQLMREAFSLDALSIRGIYVSAVGLFAMAALATKLGVSKLPWDINFIAAGWIMVQVLIAIFYSYEVETSDMAALVDRLVIFEKDIWFFFQSEVPVVVGVMVAGMAGMAVMAGMAASNYACDSREHH
jgi:hypothetical protein